MNNAMLSGLTRAAQHFVNKMNQKISQNGLPKAISDSVVIEPAEMIGEGTARIRIRIGGDRAPMAAAFEWGSGLHAMEGQPKKYLIKSSSGKKLAFQWEEATNIRPESLTGITTRNSSGNITSFKVFLPYVMHPGVKPRPYVTPTLIAERKEIARILANKFVASIRIGLKTKAFL